MILAICYGDYITLIIEKIILDTKFKFTLKNLICMCSVYIFYLSVHLLYKKNTFLTQLYEMKS